MKNFLSVVVLLFFSQSLLAQYTVNGNALRISCNEYRLTNPQATQTGSVWNNIKINFNQSCDADQVEIIACYLNMFKLNPVTVIILIEG